MALTEQKQPIAICGLGGIFPDAANVKIFWQNICANHVAISNNPTNRWDPNLFYSSNRKQLDKTYTRLGGFIREFHFDAKRFRIPPKTAFAIDKTQQLALVAVASALEDAGLSVFGDEENATTQFFDRERCAVIFGNTLGGEQESRTDLRVWTAEILAELEFAAQRLGLPPQHSQQLQALLEATLKERLPVITEDTMPGELPNCITGRICNALNLRGANFTVDAACASSLLALQTAMHGLHAGTYDTAIVGGSDCSMDPPTYVKFCRIGALSADGSTPFDARANGFVMGEGAGAIVLKRLDDARNEQHKIYAVITGIGSSSDGRGKGIVAPNALGQKLAVCRAWDDAQRDIGTASLFEAHGTSTVIGDTTELMVLTQLLQQSPMATRAIPIGSVKSMIGHLKSAAGIAALIKTTLALHHRLLPPSANFMAAPPDSPLHQQKLIVNTTTQKFPESFATKPYCAGVSAFGFGGINCHVVLEEYNPTNQSTALPLPLNSSTTPSSIETEVLALFAEKTGYSPEDLQLDYQLEADLGIDSIKQAEILSILQQRYPQLQASISQFDSSLSLKILITALASKLSSAQAVTATSRLQMPHTLVFVAPSTQALFVTAQQALSTAADWQSLHQQYTRQPLQLPTPASCLALTAVDLADAQHRIQRAKGKTPLQQAAVGVFVNNDATYCDQGKVAFLFPGQGSQYLGMMQQLAAVYPVVAATFREAEILLPRSLPLSAIAWQLPTDGDKAAADLRLQATENCQPLMLVADIALYRLLEEHGIGADMVAGHSLGEWAAAVAAGVLNFGDALEAVSIRGREMAQVQLADQGMMAVVAAHADKVAQELKLIPGYVVAANKNCHSQTVIAGETASVQQAILHFTAAKIDARAIPVSHAFHSKIVASAQVPLKQVLQRLKVHQPRCPIFSNVTGGAYPADTEAIINLLVQQLAAPVEFIAQIEQMYQQGARIFVEVGPKRALTSMVHNILHQRHYIAIACNHPKKDEVLAFSESLACLRAYGIDQRQHRRRLAAAVKPVATPPITRSKDNSPLVISGCALALPGPATEAFAEWGEASFKKLLHGQTCIQTIPQALREEMAARHIVRLNKEKGTLESLTGGDEVAQLAAWMPDIDIAKIFGLDPALSQSLGNTATWAVAIGLEALRDAGLPLMQYFRTTSTGQKLSERWGLPYALGQETGVILASAFPDSHALVQQAQAFGQAQAKTSCQQALTQEFLNWQTAHANEPAAIAHIQAFVQQLLTAESFRSAADYQFPRKWLFKALSLGHAQLAQIIGAKGPNTQINAACASGSQALALAADWLRCGRCARVIVVSVDTVTHPQTLGWYGAGFLATGAATVEPNLSCAAVPFGQHRNGLILGAAATGFVVEHEKAVYERGMIPLVELIYDYTGNSAYHGTRLEPQHIGEAFVQMQQQLTQHLNCDLEQLCQRMLFMSHETYTPARGGSATAEIAGLQHAFGDSAKHIVISNTKGYTGHPMGASVEDALAIKSLQQQVAPPLANANNLDPAFANLRFSQGEPLQADIAVRFAAGFGSQLALLAYRRISTATGRLSDPKRYQQFLATMTQQTAANIGLEVVCRTLRLTTPPHGVGVEALGIPALQAPATKPVPTDAVASTQLATSTSKTILAEITALFAEHTGYDQADLQPNYDLEADLGIDSVKQAELLAILRQRYPLLQTDLTPANLNTLDAIATAMTATNAEADSPPPPSLPLAQSTPAAATTTTAANYQDTTATLVALFADYTGYSQEDLQLDYDLESDLGIDSVKQAEILALLRERFAIDSTSALPPLAQLATLRAIVDYISNNQQAEIAVAPGAMNPSAPLTTSPLTTVQHVGLKKVAMPTTAFSITGKQLVVIADDSNQQQILLSLLNNLGAAQVTVINWAAAIKPYSAAATCELLLAVLPNSGLDIAQTHQHLLNVLQTCRLLVQARQDQIHTTALLFIGHDGGGFGCARQGQQAWLLAGVAGITKTLAKEWGGTPCLVMDVEANTTASSSGWHEIITRGLQMLSVLDINEVAYFNQAFWAPLRTHQAEHCHLAAAESQLSAGDVVVATGGARGVTFKLLEALAQRMPLDFVVLGRTPAVDPATSPFDQLSEQEQWQLARTLLEQQKARVTPAAIRGILAYEHSKLENHRNLTILRNLGSTARLITTDVCEPTALTELQKRLQQEHGAVALLIHGAGIEESKHLKDKTVATMNMVLAVKGAAVLQLWQLLTPRRVVTMGSVSARYGNAAQTDYAAANEVMAAIARTMAYTHSLSAPQWLNIGWTAWRDVGMAARGSVRQVLESMGVTLLDMNEGANLGAQLCLSSIVGDIVVAGELGRFNRAETVALAATNQLALPPLFDTLQEHPTGLTLARTTHPNRDIGLHDHRIDGISVMPGVWGLELMMQAAKYTAGLAADAKMIFEDVIFIRPLKFFKDSALTIYVHTVLQAKNTVSLQVYTYFCGPDGKQVRHDHYRAIAVITDNLALEYWHESLGPARTHHIDNHALYQRYFHGPSFQVIATIDEIGDHGLTGTATDHPQWFEQLPTAACLTSPSAIEVGFQLCGLWQMLEQQEVYLPSSIRQILFFAPAGEKARVQIVERLLGDDSYFDIFIMNQQGELALVLTGYTTKLWRSLHKNEYFDCKMIDAPHSKVGVTHLLTLQAELERCPQMVQTYLSPQELQIYQNLIFPKRKLEWLGARIAAKQVLRAVSKRYFTALPFDAVTIDKDKLGAPQIISCASWTASLHVSLTHAAGLAMALLTWQTTLRPGLDVERVATRHSSFTKDYFTIKERAFVTAHAGQQDVLLAQIWAIKEAYLKALGIDAAHVNFQDIEIVFSLGSILITPSDAIKARSQELNVVNTQVYLTTTPASFPDQHVVAQVLLHVHAQSTWTREISPTLYHRNKQDLSL